MNCYAKITIILVFVVSMVSCFSEADANSAPKPALFSVQRLNELKESGIQDTVVITFLEGAKKLCDEKPLTVVGKQHSYSNNPHDYCSVPPYSWPDDNNPDGPYITKDGITNPIRKLYDRPKLDLFANRLQTLSIAYYLTDDIVFYNAFLLNVETWFLNESTYMEPNMEYAQVAKGRNNNRGQSYGLVELTKFTPILESIMLVNLTHKIDHPLYIKLQDWFSNLLTWTMNSQQWKETKGTKNNIISGCYVVIVEMARFTGNKRLARKLSKEYTKRILDVQIDDEGKQPAELRRTNAFGYSVGNLKNIVDFSLIMENSGVKYYKTNKTKIDSAFEYLFQFVGNHNKFPYQQINSWEPYENMLQANALRLGRMSSGKSDLKMFTRQSGNVMPNGLLDYVY